MRLQQSSNGPIAWSTATRKIRACTAADRAAAAIRNPNFFSRTVDVSVIKSALSSSCNWGAYCTPVVVYIIAAPLNIARIQCARILEPCPETEAVVRNLRVFYRLKR